MKYEDGYLIMEEADLALIRSLMFSRIAESYEAEQFLSDLADCKEGAANYLKSRPTTNDKTARELLQEEVLQLYIEVCDTLTARAREALTDVLRLH